MTDYTELVKALRYCGNFTEREGCDESCEYFNDMDCPNRIMSDAAAAIEELQAEVEELKAKKMKLAENSLRFVGKVRELDKRRLEPKRGEWIGKSDDDSLVKCSVCGHIRIGSSLWYCKQYVPYCENCGAKMEVQDGANRGF